MSIFPTDIKKIKERIKSYERALKKEYSIHNSYDDGYGKRYLLGPMYLLADDYKGAVKSYEWYEHEFPDDVGEPFQYACWVLALYKVGDFEKATKKMYQTIFVNIYLIPFIIGIKRQIEFVRFSTNYQDQEYIESMPDELLRLWDDDVKKWATSIYNSEQYQVIEKDYLSLTLKLDIESDTTQRGMLIKEIRKLENKYT